ncbi:MAG TPA: ATP-binding protein, partial [Burkholderiales bacterium]|nr:ATP-binding protein [Burkholderiales bacterium]
RRDATVTMEFLQSVADVENEIVYRQGRQPELRQQHFEEFFEHVSRLPDVLRANIYTPDRMRVWSSNRQSEPVPAGPNSELDAALAGELHVELGVAGPNDPKPEHAHLSDQPVRYVELYVPLRDRRAGNVIGVAELYRVPTALFETIQLGTRLVWSIAIVGALLLYCTLFWIVYGADRTIRTQRERLVDTERLAAVGELSAAVAHGIRNPLASIRSSAELCLTDATPQVLEAASDVIMEADNLERWVHDLLAYSRPDRDSSGVAHLGTVTAHAEATFRREWARRQVAYSSNVAADLPAVTGDEALLEHVFCSLFANALEAMPEGGKLDLSAKVAKDGKAIQVTIADTGHGIDPAQLSRLFTDRARTTKAKGMGLGLALVRHIIRRCGGDVRIESEPKQGTRVILTLSPAH